MAKSKPIEAESLRLALQAQVAQLELNPTGVHARLRTILQADDFRPQNPVAELMLAASTALKVGAATAAGGLNLLVLPSDEVDDANDTDGENAEPEEAASSVKEPSATSPGLPKREKRQCQHLLTDIVKAYSLEPKRRAHWFTENASRIAHMTMLLEKYELETSAWVKLKSGTLLRTEVAPAAAEVKFQLK